MKSHSIIMDNENDLHLYIVSIYWAIMTLTTVGYGDITPRNIYEIV